MDRLAQHIEALVFASDQPITRKEIKSVLEETFKQKFKKQELETALLGAKEKFQTDNFAIELVEIAGGFQFLSKPAFHNSIGTYLKQTTKKRLSTAALETLSIIAYKQPCTKAELERIRGVNCDYSVEKLLEKDLVEILGRRDGPGRPLEYGTSQKFMDYFGLKSLEEMPKLKEFGSPDNTVGEAAPVEESLPQEAEASNGWGEVSRDAVHTAISISTIFN
ncbi:MAG: SMC-Scp complex subunit ScpB [Saprospiraceae bacterium]|nr:SMC-Scp complex subunit ScpB [Saprospiraceae bacterium]